MSVEKLTVFGLSIQIRRWPLSTLLGGTCSFVKTIHLHPPTLPSSAPISALVKGKKLDIHRWHRCLRHPSLKTVKKTLDITSGMDLNSGEEDVELICRPYNMGKAIRTVSCDP